MSIFCCCKQKKLSDAYEFGLAWIWTFKIFSPRTTSRKKLASVSLPYTKSHKRRIGHLQQAKHFSLVIDYPLTSWGCLFRRMFWEKGRPKEFGPLQLAFVTKRGPFFVHEERQATKIWLDAHGSRWLKNFGVLRCDSWKRTILMSYEKRIYNCVGHGLDKN